MRVGIRCLLCCCAAFLPKPSEDDEDDKIDYYERLGVTKDATYDEIRKAYKRKSLRCHPDKIAQRGGNPADVNPAEFQNLKDAYDVLSDSDKRELYDAVGADAMIYLTNPNSLDPMNMYENLQKSPSLDKCKIFSLVLLLYGFIFIQPILVCLKVDGDLDISSTWVLVMIPFWIFSVFNLLGLCFRWGRSVRIKQAIVKQLYKGAHLLQFICIVVTVLFLAFKLDEKIDWDYLAVLSPLFLYEWIQLTIAVTMLTKSVRDVDKMVSLPQVEKEIGRLYADLSPEEKDEVNKIYIIVHPPPSANDLDSSASAHYNVENTPEYQNALRKQTKAYKILFTIMIHSIFLGLLIPKLDKYEEEWNWWLVFMPIWIINFFLLAGRCSTIFSVGDQREEEEEYTNSGTVDDDEEQQKEEKTKLFSGEKVKQPSMATNAQSVEPLHVFTAETVNNDNNNVLPQTTHTTSEPISNHEEEEDLLGGAAQKESYPDTTDDNPPYAEVDDSMNADERTEAAGTCCPLFFLITTTCLFVGKLQGRDYSSFWILFPVFFVAGIILCCCSCIIFCAPEYDDDEPQPVTNNNSDSTRLLYAAP